MGTSMCQQVCRISGLEEVVDATAPTSVKPPEVRGDSASSLKLI